MLSKKLITGVFLLVCFFIGPAYAAEPRSDEVYSESFWGGWFDRMESKKAQHEEQRVVKSQAKRTSRSERLFSDVERSNIRNYYRHDDADENDRKGKKNKHKNKNKQKQKKLPYGLQKKLARGGQLPPGWQDKVSRGEVLDDEMLRHSTHLPNELARRLPGLEDGVVIRRVGDKVVRVLEGNGTVLDVIDLADIVLR